MEKVMHIYKTLYCVVYTYAQSAHNKINVMPLPCVMLDGLRMPHINRFYIQAKNNVLLLYDAETRTTPFKILLSTGTKTLDRCRNGTQSTPLRMCVKCASNKPEYVYRTHSNKHTNAEIAF